MEISFLFFSQYRVKWLLNIYLNLVCELAILHVSINSFRINLSISSSLWLGKKQNKTKQKQKQNTKKQKTKQKKKQKNKQTNNPPPQKKAKIGRWKLNIEVM